MPILLDFIELMKKKYNNIIYIFHSRNDNREIIQSFINKSKLTNCNVISDDIIKQYILNRSILAVSKSGTISLEICNSKIPSIILYKMGFINFIIIRILVKTKFANLINIAANKMIIPELLQSKCNAKNIYNHVNELLENPEKIKNQIRQTEIILNTFKTKVPSSEKASEYLNKLL